MNKYRNADDLTISDIATKIFQTIEKVYTVFGDQAFRRWIPETKSFDRKLNLSIMDCQMLVCEKYDISILNQYIEEVNIAFKKLFEDTDFLSSISEGTSGKKVFYIA